MLSFKINNEDFSEYVTDLSTSYKTLLSGASGKNARGNTVVDIITEKKALSVSFRTLDESAVQSILDAVAPYSVTITYSDPKTNNVSSIRTHVSDPSVSLLMNTENKTLYKTFTLSFEEI